MRKLKTYIFVSFIIFSASCNVSEKNEQKIEDDLTGQLEAIKLVEEVSNPVPEEKEPFGEYFSDVRGSYYLTEVNSCSVFDYPSSKSNVIMTLEAGEIVAVAGFSEKKENFNNQEGYWVLIRLYKQRSLSATYEGWVFCQNVPALIKIIPEEIQYVSFSEQENIIDSQLIIRSGEVNHKASLLHKEASQSFFTFVWSDRVSEFSYYNIPGYYIFDPIKNEIKKIAYPVSYALSGQVAFTDDLTFLLLETGSAPGVRGFSIYEIETRKLIKEVNYYLEINLNGYEMDIVESYNDWTVENGKIDEVSISYAEKYLSENPIEKEDSYTYEILVKYRYNFKTGVKIFMGCEVYTFY